MSHQYRLTAQSAAIPWMPTSPEVIATGTRAAMEALKTERGRADIARGCYSTLYIVERVTEDQGETR